MGMRRVPDVLLFISIYLLVFFKCKADNDGYLPIDFHIRCGILADKKG